MRQSLPDNVLRNLYLLFERFKDGHFFSLAVDFVSNNFYSMSFLFKCLKQNRKNLKRFVSTRIYFLHFIQESPIFRN